MKARKMVLVVAILVVMGLGFDLLADRGEDAPATLLTAAATGDEALLCGFRMGDAWIDDARIVAQRDPPALPARPSTIPATCAARLPPNIRAEQ
jgi:hypothetical protein